MLSPACEKAVASALANGNAVLKFITSNDVGSTGSHQYGYYLPKALWQSYTGNPPERGVNAEEPVAVTWQDGRVTDSRVKWYGQETRSEYRLTRLGPDFPFRTADDIGSLLVLVRVGDGSFEAFVLDLEDDIDEIQSALGVEVSRTGAAYLKDAVEEPLSADDCIGRRFREFAAQLETFPPAEAFSGAAREALLACIPKFGSLSTDKRLLDMVAREYDLFRMAERVLCTGDILRTFKSVDDFVSTALTIMNRRKARAGRALESHVCYLLTEAQIPFERCRDIQGWPDIVIPSSAAYHDASYPEERLLIVGVKTTLKDRWRQVLHEAPRVHRKHILTTQQGVSARQLQQMEEAGVVLVVPKPYHNLYPADWRSRLVAVDQFIKDCGELREAE